MIDAETDSRERERRRLSLEDEKMEFFAAVEQRKLVLGDTLVHIAARLGHISVLNFLFLSDYPVPPPSTAASSVGSRLSTPATASTTGKSAPAPLPLLVPNFRGELPRDVVAKALPSMVANGFSVTGTPDDVERDAATTTTLQLALAGAADVHAVFGAAYRDEPKVHRLVRSLRRLWPRWMFEGQQEAALLVRVLYDTRSSDAVFVGLVRVTLLAAERFRVALALEGVRFAAALLRGIQAANGTPKRKTDDEAWADAERVLQHELSCEDKLQLLDEWFARWFPSKSPSSVNDNRARRSSTGAIATSRASDEYVAFFDASAPVWLQLAHSEPTLVAAVKSLPPSKRDAAGEVEPLDAVLAGAAITLKRHELQLWKRRVRPPPAEMDDMGTHISALEAFAQLPHLKA